jgi:photosystem II stability/assembly factor-like uncharacterized protein
MLLPLSGIALLVGGCTLVGQGALHVQNDLSGLGADNTVIRFYAHNAGDTWPASGELGVLVQGDDFGSPPSFGLNGTLLLVSTLADCPMSEGAPETFAMADVTTIGSVPVINGRVNQAFRVPDAGASRAPRWALIEPTELSGFPGEHKIHRCGTVTFVAGGSATVDPCTLRTSIEGNALTAGKSFALTPFRKWQFCYGGAAAGSNEKFLFLTTDGGASWSLISRTTLGAPPAEAGVGELPNGNGASALFFQDEDTGWLGLSSSGHNLLKSTDGGHDWKEVVVEDLAQGVPVTSIGFSSEDDGTFTTPDDIFVTDDGGATWTIVP